MRIQPAILTISFLLLLTVSCSQSSNLVTPPNIPDDSIDSLCEYPVDVLGQDENTFTDNRGIFGAWHVRIDTVNLIAEIIPARNSYAIGDIFDADLSQFLFVSPCENCLRIPRIYIDAYGNVNIDVGMKHPFDDITTRPDLHGFDVRAIFIHQISGINDFSDIKIIKPDASEVDAFTPSFGTHMLNADGYTNHFDEIVTDPRYFINGSDEYGVLNPFLRFFEDDSTGAFDPHTPQGNNVMPVGSAFYERTAVFGHKCLEYEMLDLYIVADVAYGQSAVFTNRPDPEYYLPAFHRTEPWRVEYYVENNNLTYSDPTSTAEVVVQVFDWQHGYAVDPSYPDPANPTGLPELSDVLQVELSIPGFQDPRQTNSVPESGTGAPDDPLIYKFTVTNLNASYDGEIGLLAIRDQLHGQASPSGRMPIPVSPTGFPYETQDILDYSIYLPIYVGQKTASPPWLDYFEHPYSSFDGEISVPMEDLFAYGSTILHAEYYEDPSHKRLNYAWDLDYDGSTFDVDASGLPSPNIDFTEGGKHDIGLAVRTNTVPPIDHVYTLPVYVSGTAFHNSMNLMGQWDLPGTCHNHSVKVSNGKFYIVFTHWDQTQRDVWLSIGDQDGTFQNINVTDSTTPSYDPCLCVLDYGPVQGIIMVYGEGGSERHLYSTRCTLEGTNFTVPVRISIGDPGDERTPCLISYNDKLCVYYANSPGVNFSIYGAHSDNWGSGWTEDGWIVNNGSINQASPTAVIAYGTVYLFWADWIDSANRGSDILMAKSSNGTSFSGIDILSYSKGKIDEITPACTYYFGQLAVAYVTQKSGVSERGVTLSVLNLSSGASITYPIESELGTNKVAQHPSIAPAGMGAFLVAYNSFDLSTSDQKQVLIKIRSDDAIGEYYENTIYSESVGVVSSQSVRSYPCLASRKATPLACEALMVWTDFSTGEHYDSDYPSLTFGRLNRMSFITSIVPETGP